MLALLVGGIIAQLPLAAADDSNNPFGALWDAIFDLQSRDERLQAQIDELRAERETLLAQSSGDEPMVLVSDLYATIEVETLEEDRTIIHITAGNNGPDRAAGVKLTAFYLMPLFEINSIDGDLCIDKSRGIIECIIGTLEQDQEVVIAVDATARESGKENTWTVDISTTTDDADYSNNHVTYEFETGSDKRIEEIPEVQQPEEQKVVEQEPEATTEPEQEDDSDGTVRNNNSTKVEEPENTGNQTSTDPAEETAGGNQTSTETQDSGSNNSNNNSTNMDNQDLANSESEAAEDSNSNSTNAAEDETEQPEEEGANNSSEEAQEEQQGESEPSQPTTEEQTQDQSASEESGSEPAADEPSEESPAEESSDNGQEESSESG
jgi:hypothetical protein